MLMENVDVFGHIAVVLDPLYCRSAMLSYMQNPSSSSESSDSKKGRHAKSYENNPFKFVVVEYDRCSYLIQSINN